MGELTRIDLFRERSHGGWSTVFTVARWVRAREGSGLSLVSDVEDAVNKFQGGFSEAFVKAWRMSPPGETVRVRVFERDKRQWWRVVNSYRVQLPRRVWVRPVEWDRGWRREV